MSLDRPQDQNIDHSTIADSTIQQNLAGRDALSFQNSSHNQTIINNVVLQLFPPRPLAGISKRLQPQVDWDWANQILKEQRTEIQGRLDDALIQDQQLGIVLEEQLHQVSRSPLESRRQLQIAGQPTETLEPGKLLIETFGRSDIQGKLLILGVPGAGKTTLLLSLAEQLVIGAQQNPKTVIPVIFELSTWKDDRQSIRDWLIERLYDTYEGDRKLKRYEQWLDQRVLLPLLDGLDELEPERQIKCVQKLNEFAQSYPHLAVCCRSKDYETTGVQLETFQGAVHLQPLSDEQIQTYLSNVGRLSLWQDIQASPEIHQLLNPQPDEEVGLLRIPLFLAIAASVYDPQMPFRSKADLLEQYIEKQLGVDKRRGDRCSQPNSQWAYQTVEAEPSRAKTLKYLSWIASKLKANHQADLLLEQIQPKWLDIPRQIRHYRRVDGLRYALFYTLSSMLVFGSFYGLLYGLVNGAIVGLVYGLFIGFIALLVALFHSFTSELEDIKLLETFQLSQLHNARQTITQGLDQALTTELVSTLKVRLTAGLFIGVVFGVIYGVIFAPQYGLISLLIKGLTFALLIGLLTGLIFWLFHWFNVGLRDEIKVRSKPNQGVWNSLQSFVVGTISRFLLSLVFVISLFTIIEIANGAPIAEWSSLELKAFQNWLPPALFITIMLNLESPGLKAFTQHFCLRFVLACHRVLPWRLVPFLNYGVERRLLQRIGGRYRFIHREVLEHLL